MNKDACRKLFPVTDRHIFLDHAGVGPVSKNAVVAVGKFLEQASNKSSFVYEDWMSSVEEVRKSCSRLIGSNPDEIAFIKNTSHGISIVASGLDWQKGDNLIVYEKEFPSNIYPWLSLENVGVEVRFIKARRDGEISIEDVEKLADSKTRLLSISSVQFTNGFMVDLESLGNFCSENNILFFVDSIQSLGVIPMDVSKFKIDFLAADGHKWLLSPEGTGIFYCKGDHISSITPTLFGWKSIVDEFEYERINFNLKNSSLRFEEGSMNVMGILALGASVELLLEVGVENIRSEIQSLGDQIINNALERGFKVNTPSVNTKRGGIVNISGDFDPLKLKEKLTQLNIMVNSRGGGLRVSPHFYILAEEIEKFFHILDSVLDN